MRSRLYNKGQHAWRFKREPEEKRFATAWDAINQPEGMPGTHTLSYLLAEPLNHMYPIAPTPDQRKTAATVVQWLGSPVGQGFLESLGYKKVIENAAKSVNSRATEKRVAPPKKPATAARNRGG